jgi:hypothetical protein
LKQATRAGPDNDYLGRNFAQNSHFHGNGGPPL